MQSRFLILFVLALLLLSPLAYAEDPAEQGFLAKIKAFFSAGDAQESAPPAGGGEREGDSQEPARNPDGRQPVPDRRALPPEAEVTGVPGSIGGAASPSIGYAICNPCNTVICGPGVDYEPEYQGREVDADLFVCPGRLSDCQNRYGGSCRIVGCVDPVGCTEKVHTCYDYAGAEPVPLPRGSAGVPEEAPSGRRSADSGSGSIAVDGVPGEGGCFFEGRRYAQGERFKADCNICACDEDGRVQCTLRECAPDPVCGNGICEAGEATFCPTRSCPEGEECPLIGAPCYEGTCEKDCGESTMKPVEPQEKIRCEGSFEECTRKYDVCSCGLEG